MGVTGTKELVPNSDARRRSFEKPKAKPEIGMYNDLLALKGEIDLFNGTENENQYKIYSKQLAGYSKALQDIKSATTKRDRHEEVDKAQQIINSCFVALHSNKMNERNLDHAAIESHSFINASNPSVNLSKGRRSQRGWRKLENVLINIRKLESEVNYAIELEDMGKFKFLEEKIKLLLADIDTIPSEGDEILIKKKEEYSTKLLDTFKRMKSNQRKINRNSKADLLDVISSLKQNQSNRDSKGHSAFDEYNLQILKEIENNQLVDLEVKILEFEDTTKDDTYRELRRQLTKFADQVNGMANISNAVKTKQDKTIDLIEVLLNKIKRKALKNESILQNELKNIAEIEDVVVSLEQKARIFKGKQTDQEYKIIDQGLRKQWDKLSIIIVSLQTVKNYKDRVIHKIKDNLKTLHDKSIEIEAQATFNTTDSQNILEQATKFEIHWNIIQYSMDSTEHSTNDLLLALTKLEEVNKKIMSKCKELQKKVRIKDEIKFDIHPGTYGTLNDKDLTGAADARISIANNVDVKAPVEDLKIKPLSTTDTYGKLQSIIRDITSINKTIDEFHGTAKTQKYQEIYMLLKERQECLQSVDDLGVSYLQSAKSRGGTNITNAFERLQKKISENEAIEETSKQRPQDEITELAKQLRRLRKRVDCYNGFYKDAAYVEIEDGLQECWGQLKAIEAGGNAKIQTAKNQTEEKICSYLQSLDERSVKVVATEV